ncbi:lactate utilization protein [Mesorhizobium sp. WSM2239]|uniref:Lactate utilization protein n=2 Tax=unclassified Mesorhizobium TaxID=325217 RepID=A0AAU8D5I3_9HYPH
MSSRDAILNKVRQSLGHPSSDEMRRKIVADRLNKAPQGVIPARGQLPAADRVELFCAMAEKLFATVQRIPKPEHVPAAVAEYLRGKNLPASVRMGGDPRLATMPWRKQRALEVKQGPSDGDDAAGVSHAAGGIAETGTLVMLSGAGNPTTINFLPEHHIVVIDAADIDGDLETAIAKVRKTFGKGKMPRTLNLVSGPSRSGDIEQKLILGAHGPRALHILVVGA